MYMYVLQVVKWSLVSRSNIRSENELGDNFYHGTSSKAVLFLTIADVLTKCFVTMATNEYRTIQ